MILKFFQRKVPNPIIDIFNKRLKIGVKKTYSSSQDLNFSSYTLLTDKGYIDVHLSTDEERIKAEEKALLLCKKNSIPVPNIIYSGRVKINNIPQEILIQGIKGQPLNESKLHIFDYNKVLSSLAEKLLIMHALSLCRFGNLNPILEGRFGSWGTFFGKKIEADCETLKKAKIFSSSKINKFVILLTSKDNKYIAPVMLHGLLASKIIYIDNNLEISSLSNFSQPLSGDPNYDFGGFFTYEGADRAKRLIKSYYLLGGQVEWDSIDLLKNTLQRAIASLAWSYKINKTVPKNAYEAIEYVSQRL